MRFFHYHCICFNLEIVIFKHRVQQKESPPILIRKFHFGGYGKAVREKIKGNELEDEF